MLKVAYVCAERTLCYTRKATIALMWILETTTLSFIQAIFMTRVETAEIAALD